jgi:hypothetical protein
MKQFDREKEKGVIDFMEKIISWSISHLSNCYYNYYRYRTIISWRKLKLSNLPQQAEQPI